MELVSIITVNYNQPTVTEELLRSIQLSGPAQPLDVIVVDNGSRENPVSDWRKRYPHVRFIRSEENLGFAGGNNLGIREAKGRYLFFINNDTEITAGLIESLVEVLATSPQVGIVSPKIRYHSEHPHRIRTLLRWAPTQRCVRVLVRYCIPHCLRQAFPSHLQIYTRF